MFLKERDRARLRNDWGVFRSLTADLRRLGVPDEATLADPTGKHPAKPATVEQQNGGDEKRKRGRPPKPRCEHGQIVERCEECRAAEVAEARTGVEG